MYRDEPLDDEAELIAIVGARSVDVLHEARPLVPGDPVATALDVLRVLQGWVEDDAAGRWFVTAQRRLEGRTPVEALAAGAVEEVEDAARAWAAANS